MKNLKKQRILNYNINPINTEILIETIIEWVKIKKKTYICISAVHGAVESINNNIYKIAHDKSGLSLADGRPIYWALKIFGYKKIDHMPGYYVTNILCRLAEKKKFKIGIYGSTSKTQLKFIHELKKKYKKLKVVYKYSPPFRKLNQKELNNIHNKINKLKVDLLFVALGAPKQEIWMNKNSKKINCIPVGIGAAIDFISKEKFKAPSFVEKIGLGWLVRLILEPRRLFWRYLRTNTLFLILFSLQLLKNIIYK
jgi:N-acetylglucosaminyldiphosphoundecaprenol N-acetyl-beta-D-mannosaminyltransferase